MVVFSVFNLAISFHLSVLLDDAQNCFFEIKKGINVTCFVSFLLTTFQLQKCFLFEKLFDNFFLKIEFSLEVRFFFCGVAVFGVSKG